MDILSFFLGMVVGTWLLFIFYWLIAMENRVPEWVEIMNEQEPILNVLARVPGLEIHIKGPEIEEKKT